MSRAYVILAYRLPEQVARLAGHLAHPDDLVLVHVDRKFDVEPFERALRPLLADGRVRLARKRISCSWAGFDLIEATLNGAAEAIEDGHPFEHLLYLTGQDYPCKPPERLRRFLDENAGRSFMSWSAGDGYKLSDAEREGNPRWNWDGELSRLTRRWYRLPWSEFPLALPGNHKPSAWFPRRKIPLGLVPYQGHAHWALSREAIEYVLELMRTEPKVRRFFRRVLAPDEYFFQMVLLASPLAPTIVNRDLNYIRWDGWHAGVMRPVDAEAALAAPAKYFARKFDMELEPEALDVIDAAIGSPSTLNVPR